MESKVGNDKRRHGLMEGIKRMAWRERAFGSLVRTLGGSAHNLGSIATWTRGFFSHIFFDG
jgi:hypothetical protein